MKRVAIIFALCTLSAPALAQSYPLQGKWGQDSSSEKGPVDCGKLKTVDFSGERRFNSTGGVPDLRAVQVTPNGGGNYRVTEEFRTGQINGRNTVGIRQFD